MSTQQSDVYPAQATESSTDWRTQRRAQKEARRSARRALRRSSPLGGWIGGATLIVVGLAFLARNALGWEWTNRWWALFLLIPAITALSSAWVMSHSDEPHVRQAAYGALFGGSFLLILAGALFFEIGWQLIWPFFLIGIGVSILLGRSLSARASS
ncbi:MAG: hypothetical protein WBO46_25335 [Caldilineaceae bacterium]